MGELEAEAAKPDDVAEFLDRDDINRLGDSARRKARHLTGDCVYYGSLTAAENAARDEYAEVRLSERDAVENDVVDVFVGAPEDTLDAYREPSAPVDVAVVYGDDADDFAQRLADVRELSEGADVRAVTLVPDGRTTAFTDLKAVAAARLFLDIAGVRLARDEVGDKLAQTALAYGANDIGFVDGDDEDGFDAEVAAREAGFTPVDRAESGGYDV